MQYVDVDDRLQNDSYFLGHVDSTCILLSKNAHFPWFILAPDTQETEFYKLEHDVQVSLLEQINKLSCFLEKQCSVDKINIATIGNIVPQLHIHIVGRFNNDVCWPGVVWGSEYYKEYADGEVEAIRDNLELELPGSFIAAR